MPIIIFPKYPFQENSVPRFRVRDYAKIVIGMLVQGVTAFTGKLASISGFVGGCVFSYAVFVAKLNPLWAAIIGLIVVIIVFVIGAVRECKKARVLAIRFAPSWEQCDEQVVTLETLIDTHPLGLSEMNEEQYKGFRKGYMSSHYQLVCRNFNQAETAGYPLGIDKDVLKCKAPEDFETILAAFRMAADCWKAYERGVTGGE